MLKAVLFDLDDTLIDWEGFDTGWESLDRDRVRGVFDYVNNEIHELADFETLMRHFRQQTFDGWETGRSNLRAPHLGRVMVKSLAASGVPAEHLDEHQIMEAFNWGAVPGVVMFPDVPESLALLLENDIRIGIVTNAHQPMWMRDRELEHFGLLDYFPECRFSAADVGYLKPHPRIFEAALSCMNIEADEAVFVGDNPVADIAGAQGVGMRAVLRSREQGSMSSMLSGLIKPDHIITSLHELPPKLDEWFPEWR